jgi:hypothetical protein
MTLALRAVIELFRLRGREGDLHRQVIAFSVSHDDRTVRIYGHYPVIEGKKVTFNRHSCEPPSSSGYGAAWLRRGIGDDTGVSLVIHRLQ